MTAFGTPAVEGTLLDAIRQDHYLEMVNPFTQR